ncbi:MAG: prephenate dehydratase [Candidatus Cloacimonetes bacterium]|nr:prephenate dehydratase [Candidatus Cloacimonadota bacterium]
MVILKDFFNGIKIRGTQVKNLKVAYQGIAGAYSQQAIYGFFSQYNLKVDPVSRSSFRELFETISNEGVLGMVPIENSTAGSVVQCYDLFLDYDLEIIAEYKLDVNHCLLCLPEASLEDLTQVMSHPQALSQCSNFLDQHKLTALSVFDTAGSAKNLVETQDKNTGAIASMLAAKQYGLKILKSGFQNNNNNTTKFLVVKSKNKHYEFQSQFLNKDKCSVIFKTRDIPSALYKCLGGFATNQVNLNKIESRPVPGSKFDYLFFIDFEGNPKDTPVKLALEELSFFSEQVTLLGCYHKE